MLMTGESMLTTRWVTMLVIHNKNMPHPQKDSGFSLMHTAFVSVCCEAAKNEKGNAESFRGDHVLLSFNAARPNSQHALKGCSAAVTVSDWKGGNVLGAALCAVSCGASTTQCQVGVMGSPGLRSFDIQGAAASNVLMCERLASKWGVKIVVDGGCMQDAMSGVLAKLLASVVHAKVSGWPVLLWQVVRIIEDGPNEEWMYQLE
eukprot:Hpha_TRINITY_DN16531_c0_g1::TRINITY_DN16531_c0_g1_i1::g.136307::m.136307